MSSLGRWSYTNTATIFPHLGTDEFGVPTYGAPYLIACTWQDTGATQTDTNGSEFVPESTYWFEADYPTETTEGGAYTLFNGEVYLTADGEEYTPATYAIYALSDGQSYTTSDGEEYEAISYTSTTTATTLVPKRSDVILKFDRLTVTEPLKNDGQIIRKVTAYDMTPFGNELPDWEIFT